jgi:UDP-2,4-diacetamido-2,4,6-trideoxy-beta-L-altropyranose hydrolase
MRCLTLADVLAARAVRVRFVSRAQHGNLIELLRERGKTVDVLAAAEDAPQQVDAEQTVAALRGECPDWLIVDHYELDATWERTVRPHVTKLMVIDDVANRPHVCDLLLDQNYSERSAQRYESLLPAECLRVLGPRYALLRPEYRHFRAAQQPRSGEVRRVLIFFGGSDPQNLTGTALQALSGAQLDDLEVDVVIGANNPHRAALETQAAARARTAVYGARPHLADLMAAADLAVGAGGVTNWERMCLGLPSLVVSIADNQEPGCAALSAVNLIRYLGTSAQVRADDIAQAVRECRADRQALADLAARNQLLVDGLGAARVGEHLDPTPTASLQLRRATAQDMLTYFSWANDPETRRQALRTQQITLAEHRAWFAARLASQRSHLFVLQAGELPVGQIRFDCDGAEALIDYSIDPALRGRGWAKHLVAMGIQQLRNHGLSVFRAEVKVENRPSRAVFERLGFVESAAQPQQQLKTYRFDSSVQRLAGLS